MKVILIAIKAPDIDPNGDVPIETVEQAQSYLLNNDKSVEDITGDITGIVDISSYDIEELWTEH